GGGDDGHAGHHPVQRPALAPGGDRAGSDAEQSLEGDRPDRDRERDREAVADQGGHALVQLEGVAQARGRALDDNVGRTEGAPGEDRPEEGGQLDRKSTRLNSSHVSISYAVFCLQKKTNPPT